MSEHIKNYQDWRQYPCVVYFVQKNPKYEKTYTPYKTKTPEEKLYSLVLSDWTTFGKPFVTGKELEAKYREKEFNIFSCPFFSAISSAKSSVQIVKYPVSSFDDISKIKKLNGFVRYIEKGLNEHFGVNE